MLRKKLLTRKSRLPDYASIADSISSLASTCSVSTQAVFLPLNAENTAANKHKTAAKMKAVVNAVMNGEAIAFGKKV